MSRTATTVSAAPVVTLQAPAAFALPNDQESRQRGSLGANDGAIAGLGTLAWTTGFRLAFCFGVRLAAGFAFARFAFAGLTLARLAFPAGPFAFAFAGARSSSTHSAVPRAAVAGPAMRRTTRAAARRERSGVATERTARTVPLSALQRIPLAAPRGGGAQTT